MLTVTTLRNLKRELTNFIYFEKDREIKALEELREKEKALLEDEFRRKLDSFTIVRLEVLDNGHVIIEFDPQEFEPYERINKINTIIKEKEKEFIDKAVKIERWFTLAEASNVLNIPEMPEWIKELLIKMIESVK